MVAGDVSQWYSSSSLTLHLALGCIACHGQQADMWRMSGRDPGKRPVVTKWAEIPWSLRKKEEDGGECSGYKCEVMVREAMTAAVHTVSVLACGSAWAGVFTHLSKNIEGRGWGSVKKGHTRGVCHTVWRWHLRRPTGPRSGQPMSPRVPPLKGVGVCMDSHSHTTSSSRFLLCCTHFDLLDSPLTGLACLKALCPQFLQPEVDSRFCFCGEIFPHHTTVSFPNHESAEQKRHQCASGRKEWKTFFSQNISSPISELSHW